MDRNRMPSLRIYRDMTPEMAQQVAAILLNMPGATTFCLDRYAGGATRIWMSKRGYDYLQKHLAELKETGVI